LNVTEPVAILLPPNGVSASLAERVVLEVQAIGTGPLSYQWRKAGVDIPGATAASYVIQSFRESDVGLYSVAVANRLGVIQSPTAELSLKRVDAPALLTQPSGAWKDAGESVVLTVATTGTGPLGYQWMRNGVEIAGGTGPSYAVASVTDLEEGDYTVRVGNAAGSVTSEAAAVRVAFDLGSIVGGGNGRGRVLAGNEGKNGINSSSGSFTAGSNMGHTYYSGYKAVPGSPFIDGVFNLGSNRVNSRGVVYSLQTGDGSHASFDYLSNNREPGGSRALEFQGKKYGGRADIHAERVSGVWGIDGVEFSRGVRDDGDGEGEGICGVERRGARVERVGDAGDDA
jgi:hypothetical protein